MLVASRGERTSEDSGIITWSEAEHEETMKTETKKNVWVENNIQASPSLRSSTSDLGATPSPHCQGTARPQWRSHAPAEGGDLHPQALPHDHVGHPLTAWCHKAWSCQTFRFRSAWARRSGLETWPDTSSWVGGPVTRRGEGGRSSHLGAGQRPLTRYLPVTALRSRTLTYVSTSRLQGIRSFLFMISNLTYL